MATDRSLADRGIVEIKMGRSKFPGKPTKIGNRKRVNLSSCSLPEDNDSSTAAKNIYLGLSMFNETFGDNETIAPGPFYGFSLSEIDEAMAEARLQQKEAEVAHKKQGIDINFWDSFQSELFSVSSFTKHKLIPNKSCEKESKTIVSFDGGGLPFELPFSHDNSDNEPSRTLNVKVLESNKVHKINKKVRISSKLEKTSSKIKKLRAPRFKFNKNKLQCSPIANRSLQSQAAKKLLNKAKMSNLLEINKNLPVDKKFILPSRSTHSSRVIKPNKRFFEDNIIKKRYLRSSQSCLKGTATNKQNLLGESRKKFGTKKFHWENKSSENLNLSESSNSSSSKFILREARLQLDKDKTQTSLLEGPFSSPNLPSLCSNTQLKINLMQSTPGNKECGVCGIVIFSKFVEKPKEFGIFCCENCQKFIWKIIKSLESKKDFKLQCLKGNGLCEIVNIMKTQHFNVIESSYSTKCQACWLKLCLKNFKMPNKLKQNLLKVLPVNMQITLSLDFGPTSSDTSSSKFRFSAKNMKHFKWFNENNSQEIRAVNKNNIIELPWSNISESNILNKKVLRKRTKNSENNIQSNIFGQNEKIKSVNDKSRQSVVLKGPRVKHVCRSASVALGQPLATFPIDLGSKKKKSDESFEDCNKCSSPSLENNEVEYQEVEFFGKNLVEIKEEDKEKKLNTLKETCNLKEVQVSQLNSGVKSKKKTNIKIENPISMDFWESYDPDEICETGFCLIGSENFSVRALCFLCGSSGQEKLIHCASCCEPYHEFCIDEAQLKLQNNTWKFDWVCPRCTICFTCGKTSGQQLKCVKCDNSYHTECVDRVGGRLLHSPDRPWVCSICLRCKSCNGVDVSVFVGNLPLCKTCFVLRQKGNFCPLCQRCYNDDDYDSKMMECGRCKCWVHAKCEGLSDEKYQVLSFLPESVEYVCRMCCVMPPAPWWIAVEAELKSGYLGVLKALSKNRKACTMLKWSPRKQCTCRPVEYTSRAFEFDVLNKTSKVLDVELEEISNSEKEINEKKKIHEEKEMIEKYQPAILSERKTSIEVINHPTESLKLTLKIMKNSESETESTTESTKDKSIKEVFDNEKLQENSEKLKNLIVNQKFHDNSLLHNRRIPPLEYSKVNSSNSVNTLDSHTTNSVTDRSIYDQNFFQQFSSETNKANGDISVNLLEGTRECVCFLDVESYNSRSKPFSPNLMSIKKKVTTSEYSSLHQFHQDMERMIATSHSTELMDLYHQTIREIFPWFDPKFSKVQNSSQKVSSIKSAESTPVKNTPKKIILEEECKIPKYKLYDQPLDYFYSDYAVQDTRICVMCKIVGDGLPGHTGRLLYCGQNEWVHCNCALWSGEVFEEIDGSLQNVHSAINRSRSIKCPECNLKGASIGCCARSCQETYHFSCAKKLGCAFMDDKTMYCLAHLKDVNTKLVQNEKEFEIRRPVYVELDKRKMKTADSCQIRFAVGSLHVNNLGRFAGKLSDQSKSIIPDQFSCTRLFWSCFEPWRIVRYHFTVRLVEAENTQGVDMGINLTVDHSKEPELVELKLKQLKYFQENNSFLEINEKSIENQLSEKRKLVEHKVKRDKIKISDSISPIKDKKSQKVVRKILDQYDFKDDENCLSDNQNTADLLPPDVEEAIFKDLPHDILDGISMQDIFMDIKNYEYNSKENSEELYEGDDNLFNSLSKIHKKNENIQNEVWTESIDCKLEVTGETSLVSKSRNVKRNRTDDSLLLPSKKSTTLKTYQKSTNSNRSYKTENFNNKWKKHSKCHVTVNLLEPQERGNMLQELKFTDGLVSISTGAIGSMKDLKTRLEENKRSIQEEGKENKFLAWQTRLQPRLLQVDGGVDSSSSGSEAGESPQRMTEESVTSKLVDSSSQILDPLYTIKSSNLSEFQNFSTSENSHLSNKSTVSFSKGNSTDSNSFILPQVDGVEDCNSDISDSEIQGCKKYNLKEIQNFNKVIRKRNLMNVIDLNYKIIQCDGGVDSECEEETFKNCTISDGSVYPLIAQVEEEPVKCAKCRCTYRTKISYQRHLESCTSDFILSSSEAEMSDEESPKRHFNNISLKQKSDNITALAIPGKTKDLLKKNTPYNSPLATVNDSLQISSHLNTMNFEKPEVKKEKVKKTYTRRKITPTAKKNSPVNNKQQVQQILLQQQSAAPALIVQDVTGSNLMSTAYIDSTPTLGYLAGIESQHFLNKTQLISTPGGVISGNFHVPSASESQVLGGLCLNAQNVQNNFPGFIIQQPNIQGPVLSSQNNPVILSSEQLMVGSTDSYNIFQDPRTGGMFLTSRNAPVFYNMETIVSNTVMQTNQFVSNVLGTTFSQTSTQIFQASEMEQIVNVPSNYILVNSNHTGTNRLFPSNDVLCVQAQPTFIQNQAPIQLGSSNQTVQPNQIFNPSIPTAQILNFDAKTLPIQNNSFRCLQPVCPPIILGKVQNGLNNNVVNSTVPQILQKTSVSTPTIVNPVITSKSTPTIKPQQQHQTSTSVNEFSNSQITKPPVKIPEKPPTLLKPNSQQIQSRSRALVDYINNFRSEASDTLLKNAEVQHRPKNNICDKSSSQSHSLNCSSKSNNLKTTISTQQKAVQNQVTQNNFHKSSSFSTELINSSSKIEVKSTNNLKIPTSISSEFLTSKTKTQSPAISLKSEKIIFPKKLSAMNESITSAKNIKVKNEKIISSTKNVESCAKNESSLISTSESIEKSPCAALKILQNLPPSNFEVQQSDPTTVPDSNIIAISMHEDPILVKDELPKQENNSNDILPLQENLQKINISPKGNNTKSLLKDNSKDGENLFFKQDENFKIKRKINFIDQNSLDSKCPLRDDKFELPPNNDIQKKSEVADENFSISKKSEEKGPKLIFDVVSDDGFKNSSSSMAELWANICDSVQEMRAMLKIPSLPLSKKEYEILGMQNHGLQHCLEQLKGVENCVNYKFKYFMKDESRRDLEDEVKENPSGSARTEKFTSRKEYDMFAWLASKHRKLPKLTESAEETLCSIRRANNLPMAMKYRNLKETSKLYVGVYRSQIHGRGLFCLREIEAGEMVIEYAGEVIRANLSDKREKYYTEKGIGCYMFRIDDHFVVDATMKGNAARFINHSCEPNCYSRVVDILGKKHIVIFALRKINIMEELTYDYKFPFEDEKISCHCLSKKCKKYLN